MPNSHPTPFEYGGDRLTENAQVKPQIPVLDVLNIQFDVAFERWVSACRHLPQSGNSGNKVESAQMLEFVLTDVINRVRAGADQAHVAEQHVPQLRKLVQTIAPKESSQLGYSRVISDFEKCPVAFVSAAQFILEGFSVGHHGAKLVTDEPPSLASGT